MDQNSPGPAGGPYDPQTGQPLSGAQPTQPYNPPQGESFRAPGVEPPPQVNVARKTSWVPLVAGIAAVVLVFTIVAGGFWVYFNFFNRPAASAARVLPANTLAYITLDTSPDSAQKAALDKMKEAFESQPGFKEAWAKIASEATKAGSDMGLTSDATPEAAGFDTLSSYLGDNVTIAVLPPSTADLEKLQGGTGEGDVMDVVGRNVVGLVDINFNPLNKKGPLVDFKKQTEQGAKAEVVEKYRDMEIRKYVTDTTTLYFTLLNDTSTAVVGGRVEPVRAVIDQFKDDKGLRDDAIYKALSGQVPQERILTLYVNLTEIYKQAQIAAPEAFENSAVQKAEGAMLFTLSAQDGGMQLDIASEVDVQGAGVQINPNAKPEVATLSDIPANSLGFLVGTDLKSAVESALESLSKQGQESGQSEDMVASTLNDFEQSTGLDLEADIVPLLGGDYVLSVSTTLPRIAGADPVPSGVFQLKLSADNRPKAEQALGTLLDKMSPDGRPDKLDVAGGSFYDLSDIGPEGVVVGVSQDRLLVVYDPGSQNAETAIKAVTDNLGKGIGSTEQWREVAKHLPRDSNSIIYLNIKGVREVVEDDFLGGNAEEYESTVAPFVRPFQYLLVGSATQATREGNRSRNHTVIFVGIGK
ncbi:MAG TPA: DUF3352 domain-containing protein [Chloroflexia bacterium]|nr:DUF3352 domain-containing protein [Chloroflexia bacterium]